MDTTLIEMLKTAGTGGLIFVVFYIYHESSTKQLNTIIDKTYSLLGTMLDQNSLQLSYLQRIDTKVTNNLWCPMVRHGSHSGREQDSRCTEEKQYD